MCKFQYRKGGSTAVIRSWTADTTLAVKTSTPSLKQEYLYPFSSKMAFDWFQNAEIGLHPKMGTNVKAVDDEAIKPIMIQVVHRKRFETTRAERRR